MPTGRSAERAAWVIGRLLAMSPAEVGLRAVRSARTLGARRARPRPQAEVVARARALRGLDGGAVLAALAEGRGTVLAGARDEAALRAALGRLGVAEGDCARAADEALEGSVPAFGWTTIDAGRPVDWLRDPVTGAQWPLVHWAALDYRHLHELGDPRCVWELNRCHHLVTMGRAFAVTRDAKYGRAVWDAIGSWIAANPPHFGINWASPLETAIRLISWAMALDLVGAEGGDEGRAADLAASVWLQARHVSDNLSVYASSRNNHLIGEAAGLCVAGTKFARLDGAASWRAGGARLVEREVLAQVAPDGVPREQAFHYGAFVLEFCLASAAGGPGPSGALADRIGRLAEFLVSASGAAGSLPAIGDADGGRAYELSDRPERQARRAASCGSFLAGLPPPEGFDPSDAEPGIWLFGADAVERWASGARSEGVRSSRAFGEGGYFVPRGRGQHGVIDCGPLGYRSIAAHGHADCLSLAVCLDGEWVIADPGTFCYHRERAWRDHFRSTAAHSTVTVDGEDQSRMLGPFLWGRRATARAVRWASHPRFDFFEGTQDGYARRGVIHRRRVLFSRSGYWIVLDDLDGAGRHDASAVFQFGTPARAAGRAVEDGSEEHAVALCGGRRVVVRSWLPPGMRVRIAEGELDPPRGWVSSGFGERHPAPALVASGTVELPTRAAFLIAPGHEGEGSPRATRAASGPGGLVLDVEVGPDRETWLFGRVSVPDRGALFEGAVGLRAVRSGATALIGLDVARWTESGRDAAHESVANLLAAVARGKERAKR